MIMNLRGRVLDWYMKFSIVPAGVSQKMLNHIHVGIIYVFRKTNFELQCITEINKSSSEPTESVWDCHHRFKTLMDKVIFQMLDIQHKVWFVATFLLHIWIPLMQQKIVSQIEALEIAMKLESSLIGEINTGMMQIQPQLFNLMVQLQDIKKGKEFQ